MRESPKGGTFQSALISLSVPITYPGKEASPSLVLPIGHEHIPSGDEGDVREIRRAVSIEKFP